MRRPHGRSTGGFCHGVFMASLDLTHLAGIVVIVGECRIDIAEVKVELDGDRFRTETSLLDAGLDDANGDARTFDMWLVVNLRFVTRDDSVDALGRHTRLTIVRP